MLPGFVEESGEEAREALDLVGGFAGDVGCLGGVEFEVEEDRAGFGAGTAFGWWLGFEAADELITAIEDQLPAVEGGHQILAVGGGFAFE